MKRIFIFANKYPNIFEPNTCVFIQQLVWSFADLGYECNVISPAPINLNIKYIKLSLCDIEKNENNKVIKVYHPKYISLGQSGKVLQKIRVRFTTFQYISAAKRVLKKQNLKVKNDIFYAHFLCPSGVAVAKLGKKYGIKSFMAHGEALYVGNAKYGNNYLKKIFKNLTGAIAVSTQNKNYLVKAGIIESSKVGIFPNGYRKERFYKIDKIEARKHFGFDNDKFIVGFCGSFDERKGIIRLEKAIDNINKDDIVFACAGKGNLIPISNKCILKQAINNNELVYFYNAIDVFCLPTKNEGCCNAIVEAMACGCPIISSNKEFNYDILNDKNSILINPSSVEEIKNAILKLYSDRNILDKLSKSSLDKAKKLTLEERAKKIIEFIK